MINRWDPLSDNDTFPEQPANIIDSDDFYIYRGMQNGWGTDMGKFSLEKTIKPELQLRWKGVHKQEWSW